MFAQGDAPPADAWTNKLIWGDNKYILASLLNGDPSIGLESLAGKVDLIYIDPPFATGQNFSYQVRVGDESWEKEANLIEEKAYRDTWGKGMESYLQMMYERLTLAQALLSDTGSIYLHCDDTALHYLKIVMDEVFGAAQFRNNLVWRRATAHNDPARYGRNIDHILVYGKSQETYWNGMAAANEKTEEELTIAYPKRDSRGSLVYGELTGPSHGAPFGSPSTLPWRGYDVYARGRVWAVPRAGDYAEYIEAHFIPGYCSIEGIHERLDVLEQANLLYHPKSRSLPRLKRYAAADKGTPPQSLIIKPGGFTIFNSGANSEYLKYSTQKPEALLRQFVLASSKPGGLVLDFFAGSGTTLAVAEKLGRRWIGCDLSRYAIQVTRKRMLDVDGCRPFQLLNLGRYERQHWQVNVLNGHRSPEQAVAEYYRFILTLYRAEAVDGHAHLHGRHAGRMVHVGPADAPVTRHEVMEAVRECASNRYAALDVLGWEWEHGLHDTVRDEAKSEGVDLRLLVIPREVMDRRAVESGDVRFHELAYLRAVPEVAGSQVVVRLDDFIIPNPELVPDDVRAKITRWSDYVDFWAVDWNFGADGAGDTFHNEWQAYRTRATPTLRLVSDPHVYSDAGTYTILVKVIDIFGYDTTQMHEVSIA